MSAVRRKRSARKATGFRLAFWRPKTRRKKRKVSWALRRQRFGKWWRGRKRSFRYARQQMAPYGAFLTFAIVVMIGSALWAGGVLAQWRLEASYMTQRFLVSQGFAVKSVNVEGRHYTTKDELYAALNVTSGDSLFHVNINDVQRRIESLDWVDQADVIRLWPDTLHIVLVERRPAALWQLGGQITLIDRSGTVISPDHLTEFNGLPHVVGPGAGVEAAHLIDLLGRYPLIKARVSAAVRVGDRRWNLRLDNGVDIQLPDRQEDQALDLLTQMDARHRLLARDIVSLDMRVPGQLFIRLDSNQVVRLNAQGVKT